MSSYTTKQRIYNAAKDLFYEKGYNSTKVTDIIDLSGTNKGCFYHHFLNKNDLGLQVFLEIAQENRSVSSLFPDIDRLTSVCIELILGFYVYFFSENNCRFIAEFASEKNSEPNAYIYDIFKANSKRKFTDKEFYLICTTESALSSQLLVAIYDRVQYYTYEEVSKFYLRNLFNLFEIPQTRSKKIIKQALELFKQLQIQIDKFHLEINFKSKL